MKTRTMISYMKDNKLWQHSDFICRAAFARAMRGRSYGHDELLDAFIWFNEGWKACNIARLNDSASQINCEMQQRSEPVPHDLQLVRVVD